MQIDGSGEIVSEEDREFVWIDELFEDKVKTQEVIFPFQKQAINNVLKGLKETLHINFMPSLLSVGMYFIKLMFI